ncbi:hypothetical protein GXB85_12130 [Cellulomonas sp. APG4]|uniref:hypothetical protein n=1 Tax=Cellulomonas sp. APG4 TaxID=1538656 RepID=UPI001ED94BA3|nr:hypothetical protein [Cellulomonas sp. APG4]NCT91693.1 hypothetical protein [Cellulomonas sp. APG4]
MELLLVFAARYAALQTRGLIDRVDDPGARLNPRISTDMETSEPIRGAIAELGAGGPRGALVIASAYDERTVARLAPATGHLMVMRLEVWCGSVDPREADVLVSCSVSGEPTDLPGGLA